MRLEAWLSLHDFQFNPFEPERWIAERDVSLHRYFVVHPLVHTLQYAQPEWVLAEPGSGKTALRRYVMFLLWDRFLRARENAPFPLFLPVIRDSFDEPHPTALDRLWMSLVRQAAALLLLAVTYSPVLFFFEKSQDIRKRLRTLWAQALPGGLDMARDLVLRVYQDRTFSPFVHLFRIDFVKSDEKWITQEEELIKDFLSFLEAGFPVSLSAPQTLWVALYDLLLEGFLVDRIYLFVDGIDGADTAFLWEGESRFASAKNAFWRFLEEVRQRRFVPKIFTPLELEGYLSKSLLRVHQADWRMTFLHWTPHRLRELIDRRIAVATQEVYLGLDDLVRIEEVGLLSRRISREVRTPREALKLVYWLFQKAAEQDSELITRSVLEQALRAFYDERQRVVLATTPQ